MPIKLQPVRLSYTFLFALKQRNLALKISCLIGCSQTGRVFFVCLFCYDAPPLALNWRHSKDRPSATVTQQNRVPICIHRSNGEIMQTKRGSGPAPFAHLMSFISVFFTTSHELMHSHEQSSALFSLCPSSEINLLSLTEIHWPDRKFICECE